MGGDGVVRAELPGCEPACGACAGTRQVRQREEDVGKLYSLSQEMMLFEDADRLLRDLPGAGRDWPHLHSRWRGSLCRQIRSVFTLRLAGQGPPTPTGTHAGCRTEGLNPTIAPFAGYQTNALALGLKPVGALAWRPDTLSLEVATAVSAQVSIAVARSIAIAASTRIEAAREADRLRTALIDSLTHESRTPLTSIRAAATTLLEGEGLDEAGRIEMVRHRDRRRGGEAEYIDRRGCGDG